MTADSPPRLFLIDGYALIYRSYYAFISNPLTNSKGENTSAAWGVANFLMTVLEDHNPEYLAVVFDAGRSHREKLYPEYKATREKMPDDLREGLPRVRELIEAFHGPVVALEGFEADDVIGTLAKQARSQDVDVVIVSGDKDFYQLLGSGVSLLNPGRGGPQGVAAEHVGAEGALAKFGVPAERIIDYLALVGDSSDNVPGAPGVGPKTAVSLLNEFGSLDALFERAGEIKAKRPREAFEQHADTIRLSRELVTIITDLPLEISIDDLKVGEPDFERLKEILLELEFRTLVERMDLGRAFEAAAEGVDVHILESPAELAAIASAAREAGSLAIHTVSGPARAVAGRLAGVGLAVPPDANATDQHWPAWYLPLSHSPPGELMLDLMATDDTPQLPGIATAEMVVFQELLADPDVAIVGHDLKETLIALAGEGAPVDGPLVDVMVQSYVLDPGRRGHDLGSLGRDFLGLEVPARKSVVGTAKSEVSMHEVPVAEAGDFAAVQAATAARLADQFGDRLAEEGLDGLMARIETPLIPVLAAMEVRGIGIDSGFFRTMSAKLGKELAQLQSDIYESAGREFNL
ncbi:MAG: DNA polymerase-1, partial [Myxococcota bacterium]